MARSPTKEITPSSNKRPRQSIRAGTRSEKKKRLTTSSIASITPINFDSSESESEREPVTMATRNPTGGDDSTQADEFPVSKTSYIGVNELEKLLDKRFSVLATADQIGKMGERIERNESDIREIKGELKQMNKKMTDQNYKRLTDEQCVQLNKGMDTQQRERFSHVREASYIRSRKSLRIWPIEGTSERTLRDSLETFMRDALKISSRDIENIPIQEIRRSRSSPNALTYLETIIVFEDTEDRDFVASRAVNLGGLVHQDGRPKAGIRLDVPTFLLSTFKDLNGYAYNVRRIHGKKAKTHVKFDEANRSLILELRLPGSDNWLKITPSKARDLTTEANESELMKLQKDMKARAIRYDVEEEDSWSDSVNSLPLGNRGGAAWQPPERAGQSRMEFGGSR